MMVLTRRLGELEMGRGGEDDNESDFPLVRTTDHIHQHT